ncbi:hypothetical protein F4778DRAFT_758107, partial [Xylariomycetidae sp. FL2044]
MSRAAFFGSTRSSFPIYPRSRSMTSCLEHPRTTGFNSSTAPYTRIQASPLTTEWIYYPTLPSLSKSKLTISRSLRTMADPLPRTASPYTDPSVKGPKSQQLSSGLSHSLLQDTK